ncbi:hypothetical protein [Vreelandella sp. EE27]
MPRSFSQSTAELTVQVAEAVCIKQGCDSQFVQDFCDLSGSQANAALELAADIGLVVNLGVTFQPKSPFINFLCTPEEAKKAAILRILLESYEPFLKFRERLLATGSVDYAAQQTKILLDLDAHREEVKDTLISLGTYAKAIQAEGGGRYTSSASTLSNQLMEIAESCTNLAEAEACIRTEIGDYSEAIDRVEVLHPLASALLKARNDQPTEAVAEAATAIESFLARLATRMDVNLAGATGLNSRLEKFRQNNALPKKVVEAGKYLGQIRNAADHGVDVDPDVGAIWKVLDSTGVQYVFVACSFIRACGARENQGDYWI